MAAPYPGAPGIPAGVNPRVPQPGFQYTPEQQAAIDRSVAVTQAARELQAAEQGYGAGTGGALGIGPGAELPSAYANPAGQVTVQPGGLSGADWLASQGARTFQAGSYGP